jgi:hypothetical protein
MGTIWIFKTNYANPVYQVEFSPEPGMVPKRFRFSDLHELRYFLDSHRLPDISADSVIRTLESSGHAEIRTSH